MSIKHAPDRIPDKASSCAIIRHDQHQEPKKKIRRLSPSPASPNLIRP
jgi:hypothetical protein